MGAQVLCVPAAFTRLTGAAHWHALLCSRAIENTCYVLAAAQCGEHPGLRQTYGHSMIVDPWGKIIAELDDLPGVAVADLNLARVDEVRRRLPSLAHDRII
jgi:predicted amidohydrolase